MDTDRTGVGGLVGDRRGPNGLGRTMSDRARLVEFGH